MNAAHCRKPDSQFYFKLAERKTCDEAEANNSGALPGPVSWPWPGETTASRSQCSTRAPTSCSAPSRAGRESTERGWCAREGSLYIGRNNHGSTTGHCVHQVAGHCHGSWSLPDPVAATSSFSQVPSVLHATGALDRSVLARELPLYFIKCN